MSKKKRASGEDPAPGQKPPGGFPRFLILALIAVFGVLLLRNQFIVLRSFGFGGLADPFLWTIIPALLILIEWRTRALERWIDGRRFGERSLVIGLAAATFVILRAFLAAGNDIYRGDSTYFVWLNWISWINFRSFNLVHFWNWFGGCGSTVNQFYSPVLNLVGGFFNLAINDVHLSVKLTNLLFRFLSAYGIYLFVRELTSDRKAGVLAAIACLLIHQLNHSILFPGRFSAGAELGVLPFLFYFFERWLKDRKWASLTGISIFSALMVLTHLKSSVLGLSYFGLYVLLRSLLLGKGFWKNLLWPALFAGVGLLVDTYSIAGYVLERKYAGWGSEISINIAGLISAQNPTLSYFVWNNSFLTLLPRDPWYRAWQGGYLGITVLVLFVLAGAFVFLKKHRNRAYLPLWILTLSMLVFTFFLKAHDVFKAVPFLNSVGTEKFLIFYAFFSSATAGLGALAVARFFPPLGTTRAVLICLAVVCVDLLPTTFQIPYGPTAGGSASPFMEWMKKEHSFKNGVAMNGRLMLAARDHPYASDNWRNYDMWLAETSGVPLVTGHYVDNYYKTMPFLLTLNNLFAELTAGPAGEPPPELMTGLFLTYTRFITTSPYCRSALFGRSLQGRDMLLSELREYSPLTVATRLRPFDFDAYYADPTLTKTNHIAFLKDLKLDRASLNMNFIPVSAGDLRPDLPDPGSAGVKASVLEEKTGLKTVRLALSVDKACYARLAFANYPWTVVTVDGTRVKQMETLEGMILLMLEPGTHRIVITPRLSPLRTWSLLLAALVAGLLLLIVWVERKKRKGSGPDDAAGQAQQVQEPKSP